MKQKDFFKRYGHYFFTLVSCIILLLLHLAQGHSGRALIWGAFGLIWTIRIYFVYKRNSKDE